MAYSIVGWNINPNIVWYVKLYDAGSGIEVQLYLSASDASSGSNRQAAGSSSGYGTAKAVTLTNEPGATKPVEYFQDTIEYHLLVSGNSGEATTVVQVKEFVDLPDIDDPMYTNEELIPIRAGYEIDLHTHSTATLEFTLAVHDTSLEPGQIASFSDSRRETSFSGQIESHSITGDVNSLVSTVEAVQYFGVKR